MNIVEWQTGHSLRIQVSDTMMYKLPWCFVKSKQLRLGCAYKVVGGYINKMCELAFRPGCRYMLFSFVVASSFVFMRLFKPKSVYMFFSIASTAEYCREKLCESIINKVIDILQYFDDVCSDIVLRVK